METHEILFGISADSSTVSSYDPITGVTDSFEVHVFDYNNLQSSAEEIFIEILQKLPSGGIPGYTIWTGNFSEEEKELIIEVANDYKFTKIDFINVEGAWSLYLLSHYNKTLNENDNIGLVVDFKKIVEGSLFKNIDNKLVRIRITTQTSCEHEKLNSKLYQNFKSNWIDDRKCQIIIIEHYGSQENYQKYFENYTIIQIPYTKYNTSKGGLIRARILNQDKTFINYHIVTKIDKTLDISDQK